MAIEVIGEIAQIETIAVGRAIRELPRLQRLYGTARWRKMKGVAKLRLGDGTVCNAELHWHKAHGIGRKEIKLKRFLDA
jgi:hypothetical protein